MHGAGGGAPKGNRNALKQTIEARRFVCELIRAGNEQIERA
jgi:hypothetical protein